MTPGPTSRCLTSCTGDLNPVGIVIGFVVDLVVSVVATSSPRATADPSARSRVPRWSPRQPAVSTRLRSGLRPETSLLTLGSAFVGVGHAS